MTLELIVGVSLAMIVVGMAMGLFGGGGGVMATPLFIYLFGFAEATAFGHTLAILAFVSVLITGVNVIAGRFVKGDVAHLFRVILAGIPAAILGSYLASLSPDWLLRLGFIVIVGLIASQLLMTSRRQAIGGTVPESWGPWAAVGALAGFFSGYLGISGGVILVPGFILLLRLPAKTAIPLSVAAAAVHTSAAFGVYSVSHSMDWSLLALCFGTVAVGAAFGLLIQKKMAQTALRRGFGFLMLGLVLSMLVETLVEWLQPSKEST